MISVVAEKRKNLGYSQSKLALEVGVTRQMISAIERGHSPSLKTLKKIAFALDCSVSELINQDEPKSA